MLDTQSNLIHSSYMNNADELETVNMKPVPRREGTIVVGTRRDPGFLIPPPPATPDNDRSKS